MFGMMRSPAETYAKVGVEVAIESADPHRLILMLFDGALTAIAIAKIKMESGDIPAKGSSISKAIALVTDGLQASLDMESGGELAERLAALYEYISQRLLFANLKNNVAALDEVSELLGGLRDAWAQIEQSVSQATVR